MASKLYDDLRAVGVDPWLDKKNLLGGQNWRVAIRRAVRESSHFVALLSANSVSKRGYVQKELREAIAVLEEIPPDEIFVIPLRLEDVEPTHEALQNLHWIDLFPSYDAGLDELVRSLRETPAAATPGRTPLPPMRSINLSKAPVLRRIAVASIALVVVLFLLVEVISRTQARWMDQQNCAAGEHWVGMTPHTTERSFEVTADQAKHAVFHGELRWSPVINQLKQTTIGKVEVEVDGKHHVIYRWNSPATATHAFNVAISDLLVGTSGRFKIRWRWENGTSGVCVVRSDVVFPPA